MTDFVQWSWDSLYDVETSAAKHPVDSRDTPMSPWCDILTNPLHKTIRIHPPFRSMEPAWQQLTKTLTVPTQRVSYGLFHGISMSFWLLLFSSSAIIKCNASTSLNIIFTVFVQLFSLYVNIFKLSSINSIYMTHLLIDRLVFFSSLSFTLSY